jgi:hypothetical protein
MTIEEIKKAVTELSSEELVLFRKWFTEFDTESIESNTLQSTTQDRLKNLKGSLKGKGLLKALMDEKKRERDL